MNLKGKTMGIVLEAFLIGVAEVVLNFSWASASLEDFKKKIKVNVKALSSEIRFQSYWIGAWALVFLKAPYVSLACSQH